MQEHERCPEADGVPQAEKCPGEESTIEGKKRQDTREGKKRKDTWRSEWLLVWTRCEQKLGR